MVDGREITIKDEVDKIQKAIKQGESFGQIAKSIQVNIEQDDGSRILCKIVFAKNWRNDNKSLKKPYMAIITTRVDLSDEEICQAYKKR